MEKLNQAISVKYCSKLTEIKNLIEKTSRVKFVG